MPSLAGAGVALIALGSGFSQSAEGAAPSQVLPKSAAKLLDLRPQPIDVIAAPPLSIAKQGAVVDHRVADDVSHSNVIASFELRDQSQRRPDLPLSAEYLPRCPAGAAAGHLNHLDPQGRVVQADGVATPNSRRHDLADAPALTDQIVSADSGELVPHRSVGGKRAPRSGIGVARGEVKHDRLLAAKAPAGASVMPLRIACHLALAGSSEGNVVLDDASLD